MATKKKATPKRKSPDARPAPKGKKDQQLSEKDMDKVAGGLMSSRSTLSGNESCKETGDTGMMGCPS